MGSLLLFILRANYLLLFSYSPRNRKGHYILLSVSRFHQITVTCTCTCTCTLEYVFASTLSFFPKPRSHVCSVVHFLGQHVDYVSPSWDAGQWRSGSLLACITARLHIENSRYKSHLSVHTVTVYGNIVNTSEYLLLLTLVTNISTRICLKVDVISAYLGYRLGGV